MWCLVYLVLLAGTCVFLFLRWREKSTVPTRRGTVLIYLASASLAYTWTLSPLLDYIDSLGEIRTPEFPNRRIYRLEKAEAIGEQFQSNLRYETLQKKAGVKNPSSLPKAFDADDYFNKINAADKASTSLTIRRVIFDQWQKRESKPTIENIRSKQSLPGWYLPEQEADLIILNALSNLDKNAAPVTDTPQRTSIEEILKTRISPGWYRNCALRLWYEKTHEYKKLEQLNQDFDRSVEEFGKRGFGFAIYAILTFLFVPASVISTAIYFWKRPFSSDNNTVSQNSLRSFYCALLCTAWFTTLALSALYWLFIPIRAVMSPSLMPTLYSILLGIGMLIQDGASLLFIWQLMVRPMAHSLAKALARPALISVPWSFFWSCSTFAFLLIPNAIFNLIFQLFTHHLPQSTNPVSLYITNAINSNSPVIIFLLILFIAVIGPIVEEVVFRGVLYSVLKRKMGVLAAALLSGFMFGLLHRDLELLPQLTIMGFVLAIVYERTGRLSASIVAHGINNLASVLISIYMH